MTKELGEFTLNEIKEMCIKIECEDCPLYDLEMDCGRIIYTDLKQEIEVEEDETNRKYI